MIGRRNSFDERSSLDRWIAAPLRWLRARGQANFDRDPFDEKPANTLVDWVLFPLRLVAGIGLFLLYGWAGSRSAWNLLLGLPAAVCMLSVFLAGVAYNYLAPRNYYRYHAMGLQLLKEQNGAAAEGFLRKACVKRFPQGVDGIPPSEKDWMVDIGKAIQANEDLERAVAWIEMVSPRDSAGNFAGHLWIAQQFLNAQPSATPQDLQVAQEHLRQAETQKLTYRNNVELEYEFHATVCRCCLQSALPAEAKPHLQRMAELNPIELPQYLATLRELKEDQEFQTAYREGMTRLNELAATSPNVPQLWIAMARAAVLNDDYAQGLEILQTARAKVSSEEVRQQLRLLVAEFLLEWHRKVFAFDDDAKFRQGIRLLALSLSQNPANAGAYESVRKIIDAETLSAEQLEWYLNESSFSRGPVDVLHALLGAYYLWHDPDQGVAKARNYWSIVESYSETSGVAAAPLVLVHLAIYMSGLGTEERQRGLDLLDLAISNAPTRDIYMHAKAKILMDEEKWEAARAILEPIVQPGRTPPNVIKMLERCATELGDFAAADRFRQMGTPR